MTAAYNAAETLERMLGSVLAQSWPDWELILVDDGSTDATGDLAVGLARRDPRVRALSQANAGASAARNLGAAAAHGDWLLFLDADDTLAPRALETLLAATAGAGLVCCAHRRLDAAGKTLSRRPAPALADGRLAEIAAGPPMVLHAALLRRDLFDALGGFDPSLKTHEDWDLWARLARSRARVATVPQALADYWSSQGSLTKDAAAMVRDRAEVLRRLSRPDPRIADPDPRFAQGFDTRAGARQLLATALWCAASAAGEGRRAEGLAEHILPLAVAEPPLDDLSAALLEGLAVGARLRFEQLAALPPEIFESLTAEIGALCAAAGVAPLAPRLVEALERDVLRVARLARPARVGGSYAAPALMAWALAESRLPAGVQRIYLKLPVVRPRSIGLVRLKRGATGPGR